MAYVFGDGFDLYAAVADIVVGYWDSGSSTAQTIVAGRFTGSQAIQFSSNITNAFVKSSTATTDPVHHIVCAFRQTAALSGTTLGLFFQLSDAATNQCCIVFRSDGAILLTSATPFGTTLATYTGAVTANNTWYAFEFEVIISSTVGRFRARKNGNTSDDFDSGASLNTRPGANTQANKLTVGMNTAVNAQQLDDLLWRSDASSVPWVGDIRCWTRMPASDVGTPQFARALSSFVAYNGGTATTASVPATNSYYTAFTPTYDGTISNIIVSINTGFTGNMKLSMFADNAGVPGTVIASATTIVNPVTGNATFTFITPVTVSKATQYWFGIIKDVTVTMNLGSATAQGRVSVAVSYAAFPTANPAVAGNQNLLVGTVTVNIVNNAAMVNEAQQDGTTSYVYDSTPGHTDFYSIAPIASTPVATIAVTTRGFMEKSDAGTRTAAVQLKSGGSTVSSSTTALASSSWGWIWRTDLTDPATSAAWTAAAVNNVNIGPTVVA